jgi:PAS domain S-box-containing protein
MEQERQRLEAIIEGTNIGTWEWNVINNTVVINERWANMLGYSLCDLGPITVDVWVSLLHPDDVQDSYASLQRHLSGETAFHDCKFRMRTKEGGWRWVHAHGKIVRFTPQGKPEIISGMHMDIHDSKTTYDLLCERENLLRSLLSNFPGAAYRRDNSPSQHIFFLSDAVAQLTGYAVETFMQQDGFALHSLIHPNDLESVNASIHSAIEQKTAFTLEYRIKRADGAWRYVQDFGRGVFDADNNLIYVDGFVWDIQSRKDSDAQNKLMTHKLSQLFEMAPLGIMQIHQSGKFIDTNPEISKITGYTREELKSMTFLDITPPEDIEKSKLATKNLNETGRFGPIEKHYQHKNGDLIAVEICGSEINTGLDDEKSWWTLVKDIREQRRISQMKSEFISTVSHELRTPLTSITGALGLITNNMLGALPDKAHAMLTIAYKNSQRLTLLINDLLDMEKLLAGKMYFDMQTQSLLPLIQQAVTENKAYADKYHVAFEIQCNTNEPRANIDAFRFQQVINNFLSNAAKYSQANQTVDIVISQRVDKVRVAVHDYGAGISEEFKTRIFQKFSQADSSSTREKGGTGLGLAISKELVERMQGQIGFESQMGQGACFYAEFNLEQ